MTVQDIADKFGYRVVNGADLTREVTGGYACDLLSWVIGRAQGGDAFITVMTNANVIAVALLSDVSVVILTENSSLDDIALGKAVSEGINVLITEKNTFTVAHEVAGLIYK
ncbi:hypothetical protein FACS1894219_02730 [Clostridia bacterium]|nr:hypothetical protein FACS1894219_02730 [Clostridia bacterium]